MNGALLSSKKMDYCTPRDFFAELDREFHFTLDAAATEASAKCPEYYTPETDGLNSPWNIAGGGGAVFCNPPYGRETGKWVRKAWEEAKSGTTIVLLIPARTDTSYFHEYIYGHAEIRWVRGRLRFEDEDGTVYQPAPFPSMVVVYNGKEQRGMKAETVEARAVKIAAKVMTAAGLCRYEDPCDCPRAFFNSEDCDRCICAWLLTKAKVELAREERAKREDRKSD